MSSRRANTSAVASPLTSAARLHSLLAVFVSGSLAVAGPSAADNFDAYAATGSVTLPGTSAVFDVDDVGRIVALVGTTLHRETASGSGTFSSLGSLPSADVPSSGAAFVRVSPDGLRIAVGNNGGASFSNFEVGIFTLSTLSGSWFAASHFLGEWLDDRYVALSASSGASSIVTALDTQSPLPATPVNPTLVTNIGGASAGVTIDASDTLYTGNGFAFGGPSATGAVHAVAAADWQAALGGGSAVDFETAGTPIVTVLSASSLGFDAEGNLLVGGADLFGMPADADYFALVRSSAVSAAVAGGGPIDASNPSLVRRFDPVAAPSSSYTVVANTTQSQLLAVDFGSDLVTVFDLMPVVPAIGPLPSFVPAAGTLLLGASELRRRRRASRAS